MASIVKRPAGAFWIQFSCEGRRRTVRLGACTRPLAERFARNTETLLAHRRLGLDAPAEITHWLTTMAESVYQTFVTTGLAPPRAAVDAVATYSLQDLVDVYLDRLSAEVRRAETKPATLRNATRATENILLFWGPRKLVADVTPEDANRFRSWLAESAHYRQGGLAPTTVSRRCRRVREVFQLAVDDRWIAENPLRRMRRWQETNSKRDRYVPATLIASAIRCATHPEDRLLLAMGRWGGVRVPSEVAGLRLADFDADARTIRVRSPKTEHHPGHEYRFIPLWPEIAVAHDVIVRTAGRGDVWALPTHRLLSSAALTKRARAIVAKAGGPTWPKFWTNMRASCERDLLESHPIDKVARWMGHSPRTALQHYSRVDQQRAASQAAPLGYLTDPATTHGEERRNG